MAIAIVVSLYFVITKDTTLGTSLKDASIIITITAPYIIEKILHIKISEWQKFILIAFVFLAHFLGANCEFYNTIFGFDKLAHTLSGVLTALIAILVLKGFNKYDSESIIFNIIFIMSITVMVAGIWEIFEYFANILFGGDAQRVIETGVNDTMQDIRWYICKFNLYFI
jgi:uncharacterized membrane protein YjdF